MFFTYESYLPPHVGFALYSLPHLCMLALAAAGAVFGARFFVRCSAARQMQISRLIGGLLPALDLLRYVVYFFNGGLSIYELPLHLCGLAVYLCFLHSLWKPDWLGQVLYTLCLPGACCALLFPDWNNYPFFSYTSCHSFAAHMLIVWYIVFQTASGAIRPRLCAIWKPVLFLCCVIPPVFWFDLRFHANYMFLKLPSAGSPLEILARCAGGSHAGYLVLFAAVVFCAMVCMNLPFARRKK